MIKREPWLLDLLFIYLLESYLILKFLKYFSNF